MTSFAIKVENLSKRYHLGQRHVYKTLRETISNFTRAPFQEHRNPGPKPGAIWALKDVSFEVRQGEVVGIIGMNGAGKTTLLKILSKITEPTEGRVELKGRVGSLLEVGTGFHPELSGHENVYLYGAILGMDRWEITRKFDEIVSFAELEKFIDTPVKRYSSGMYMRLAFAVAAHLEPEILLVDEILAVGDAAFQTKCLGKMGDVSKAGRTVLFVSHNMGAVEALCGNAIWLDQGRFAGRGDVNSVVNRYLNAATESTHQASQLKDLPRAEGWGEEFRFDSIWTENREGEQKNQFSMWEPIIVVFSYCIKKELPAPLVAMRLETTSGQIIVDSWDSDSLERAECKAGVYSVRVKIEPQDLHPGIYQISLVAAVHLVRWLDKIDAAMRIEILPMGNNRIWRSERRAILGRIFEWERSYEGRGTD